MNTELFLDNSPMIIGADIGRRDSKIHYPFNILDFKSQCKKCLDSSSYNVINNDKLIEINGEKWIIGEGNGISNDDKSKDYVFENCLVYALAKEDCDNFNVAAGLPVTHWSLFAKNMENKFKGKTYEVRYKNDKLRHIKINDFKVYPEGVLCLEEFKGHIILVDIGGYTTDVVEFYNGEYKDSTSYTKLGIKSLLSNIQRYLNSRKCEFTIDSIENALINKETFIDFNGDEFELDWYKFGEEILQGIIDRAKNDFNWNQCRKIFIGGGSLMLKEMIEAHGFMVEGNKFSNAMAFREEGLNIWERER